MRSAQRPLTFDAYDAWLASAWLLWAYAMKIVHSHFSGWQSFVGFLILISLLDVARAALKRRRPREKGHSWRACVDGEPREENGVCVDCGKFASEAGDPCDYEEQHVS